VRRQLLGANHPEVASVYNNFANMLRKPGVLDGASGSSTGRAGRGGQRRGESSRNGARTNTGGGAGAGTGGGPSASHSMKNTGGGPGAGTGGGGSASHSMKTTGGGPSAGTGGGARDLSMKALVEPLYRRAIAIRELVLGPKSPALAAALSNLSGQLARRDEVRQADPIYMYLSVYLSMYCLSISIYIYIYIYIYI